MGQEPHPRELWQHEQASEAHVEKVLTWSLLLLLCMAVWLAIGYSVWQFFLR